MSYRASIVGFFTLLGIGIIIFSFVQDGVYPVAMVDYHPIDAKTLDKDYRAALNYFRNALLTYGSDPKVLESSVSQKEIRRAALNKLIDDFLIYREAKKRLGSDLGRVTEKIIEQNIKDPKLESAVKEIYGLSLNDFKSGVLTAQAHKEILEGRMTLNNENFDDWLKKESGQAKIIILLPEFYWDGQQVKTRA